MALFEKKPKKLTLDEILSGIDNLSEDEKEKVHAKMQDLYKAEDEREIDKIEEDKAETETEADKKGEEVNEESEEILRTALRRAQLKEEEILRDAQNEAARIYDRAQEQIDLEKKRALSEVKDEVSGMAIEIAGAVIGREVSEKEHSQFIDSFIDSVGE